LTNTIGGRPDWDAQLEAWAIEHDLTSEAKSTGMNLGGKRKGVSYHIAAKAQEEQEPKTAKRSRAKKVQQAQQAQQVQHAQPVEEAAA
jgi:hypothetical protein